MDLAERWRQRRRNAAFLSAPAFDQHGLLLGRGTLLLPFTRSILAGRVDPAAHGRLLALLAVAACGRIARDPCEAILPAMRCWASGDRALAAIRLALARLPRLASDRDAHTLFLAEAGLDAGLSPRALLAELGHAALAPLLKDAADQPRVPAGSGRASGRWTSGAGGQQEGVFEVTNDTEGPAAATPPPSAPGRPASTEADARLVPVFLDTGRHGEDAVEDKPFLYQPRSLDDALHHGRPLDVIDPIGAPLPWPGPLPGSEPQAGSRTDEDEGPACPAMRNDRGGGTSPEGQEYEARIAALVNPSSPTPKRTPENPQIRSQAYSLSQPQMKTKEVALDDCKRTSEPSPIPNIRKGTMVEIKSRARPSFYAARQRGVIINSSISLRCKMMP